MELSPNSSARHESAWLASLLEEALASGQQPAIQRALDCATRLHDLAPQLDPDCAERVELLYSIAESVRSRRYSDVDRRLLRHLAAPLLVPCPPEKVR